MEKPVAETGLLIFFWFPVIFKRDEGHSAYWELLNTVLGAFTHDNSLTPHSLQPTNCIWERREAGSVRLPLPDSGRTRDSSMSYELLTLRLLLLCCFSKPEFWSRTHLVWDIMNSTCQAGPGHSPSPTLRSYFPRGNYKPGLPSLCACPTQ